MEPNRYTTLGLNELGSNGNEGVDPYSPEVQNWSLMFRCSLVTYPGHPILGENRRSYLSARDTFSVF